MHEPESEEKRRELAKRAAALYAQTVVDRVKALPCPAEQKLELLNRIGRYIKNGDGG